jgi:phosphatidylglycerophosphate synthase
MAILAALFLAGVGVPWVLGIVVWALAALGIFTVIQRIIHVRKQLKPRAENP